jgi:hypothetical protein
MSLVLQQFQNLVLNFFDPHSSKSLMSLSDGLIDLLGDVAETPYPGENQGK